MADFTVSPNMNLPIPTVGVDPGPDYANNLNSSLTLVDSHNHTAGNGVPIPVAGLSINADLPMNNNNVVDTRSVRLRDQVSAFAAAADVRAVYAIGVDLYFRDGNGNNVRITQSGALAGTPGSIANLVAPASATYVALSQTFVWQSAVNTPANLDGGFLILRNNVANSFGLTLLPPTAMGSNFSLTLPNPPVSTKFMRLDSSGNMGAAVDVDNSSLEIASNLIQVKALGVTKSMQAAVGQQVSSSSGFFQTNSLVPVDVTNLNVTITTVGRPVMLMVIPDGGLGSQIGVSSSSNEALISGFFYIVRDATTISTSQIVSNASPIGVNHGISAPPGAINFLDAPSAGTYTYKIQAASFTVTQSTNVTRCKLMVYEL